MLFSVIRSLFSGGSVDFMSILMQIVAVLFVIFCILPLHEFAHGWVAYKLGDNTAKYQGRLTFNPIASVDPLGALFLLLFGFGWAKPVPVNPNNFKNPKRGMAITALAGPVSNLLALSDRRFDLYRRPFGDKFQCPGFRAGVLPILYHHQCGPGGVQPAAHPASGRFPDRGRIPFEPGAVQLLPVPEYHHDGSDAGAFYGPVGRPDQLFAEHLLQRCDVAGPAPIPAVWPVIIRGPYGKAIL